MLKWAFKYTFWGLMVAALLRSVFYVITFEATVGVLDSRFRTLSTYLIVQGTIGCCFGYFFLAKSGTGIFAVNGRRNRYLILGMLNVFTSVLPIIGYWIGIPFSILQVVSLPMFAMLQAVYSLAKGHYPLHTSHIRTVIALVLAVVFFGLSGGQTALRSEWILGAAALGFIQLFRDQTGRFLKMSHLVTDGDYINDKPYYEALGENFLFTGLPLIPAGFLTPLVIKWFKPEVNVAPLTDPGIFLMTALGSVCICLALSIEIWIQKPKGGFRETSTGILARISFLAVIQQFLGNGIALFSLVLGLVVSIAGLFDEWRKFEERRKRKEQESQKILVVVGAGQ